MANVQQLEKLHHLQRLFYLENSLEGAVANERISSMINRTEQLLRQRAFLRDERRRLRLQTELIEERRKYLALMGREDWIPESLHPRHTEQKKILLNIGGLMFEIPVGVLMRDGGSLLAQLCDDRNLPITRDPEGFFYFDRDWWLFRYVLIFLRDGTLPDDRNLLAKLYREAGFWNLSSMQFAIEQEKLHLNSRIAPAVDPNVWWKKQPSWWSAIDEEKAKATAAAAAKTEDWWLDSSYKGKSFLPLSKLNSKTVTAPKADDALPTLSATWNRPPMK